MSGSKLDCPHYLQQRHLCATNERCEVALNGALWGRCGPEPGLWRSKQLVVGIMAPNKQNGEIEDGFTALQTLLENENNCEARRYPSLSQRT